MHILKLTLKQRCEIQPNSSVELPISEVIKIPENCYGKFYLRKSLAKKGLIAPDLPFHPNWESSEVFILVSNFGANQVELREGNEIGELWLIPINTRKC